MQDGKISINVGEGDCDLKIEHGVVTIAGDLKVEGSIISDSVTTNSGESLAEHTHSVTIDCKSATTSQPN